MSSDVKPPALPDGDFWEVKEITYERGKTMLIIWHRKHAGGGGSFHVASLAVKPKHYRLGFQKCYEQGLRRLADDVDRLDKDAARKRDFEAARAMAALPGTDKENPA